MIAGRATEWRSYDLDTAFRATLRSSGLALAAGASLKAPQKEYSVMSCIMREMTPRVPNLAARSLVAESPNLKHSATCANARRVYRSG